MLFTHNQPLYRSDLIISGSSPALSDLLTLFECHIEEVLGLLLFNVAPLQLLELSIYFVNVHAQLSQALAGCIQILSVFCVATPGSHKDDDS